MYSLLVIALLLALLLEPAAATSPIMDPTLSPAAIDFPLPYPDPENMLAGFCQVCGDCADLCIHAVMNHPAPQRMPTFTPETFLDHPEWPSEYHFTYPETLPDLDTAPESEPTASQPMQHEGPPLLESVKQQLDSNATTMLPSTMQIHVEDTYTPGDRRLRAEQRRRQPHRRLAPRPDGFPCSGCPKTFNRSCDLKRHSKTHLKGSERPHKCAVCDEGFLYPKDCKRHQRTHDLSPSPEATVYCSVPGCIKVDGFSRRDNLLRHVRKQHPHVITST